MRCHCVRPAANVYWAPTVVRLRSSMSSLCLLSDFGNWFCCYHSLWGRGHKTRHHYRWSEVISLDLNPRNLAAASKALSVTPLLSSGRCAGKPGPLVGWTLNSYTGQFDYSPPSQHCSWFPASMWEAMKMKAGWEKGKSYSFDIFLTDS